LLAAVVAFGFADQTAPADIPNYASLTRRYRTDDALVRSIEARLPAGASVFELPYQPFPEGSKVGHVDRYDPVRPYLHSSHLRWSYGAMEGRPEDWQSALIGQPLTDIVTGVAAAGFSGIYVDLAGYRATSQKIETTLQSVLKSRPLASSDGRLLFYDLRPYLARLRTQNDQQTIERLRTAILTPVRVQPGNNVVPAVTRRGQRLQLWLLKADQASLDLYNPSIQRTVLFKTTAFAKPAPGNGTPVVIELTWPDGSRSKRSVQSTGTRISRAIYLRHGHNLLHMNVSRRGQALAWIQLREARIQLDLRAIEDANNTN
jgi:phosphoglycerol transferase